MAIQVKELEKVSFTVKETAKILSTSVAVVYKLIDNGSLRCMKLPRFSVPYFEIERFMREAIEKDIDYSNVLKDKGE